MCLVLKKLLYFICNRILNLPTLTLRPVMSEDHFSMLPYVVDESTNVKRHVMNISSSEIERMHLLLDNSPIVDETWDNLHQDGHFGIKREWLTCAVKEWRHNYDW